MSKHELIKRAISGEKQTEVPFSFWTHIPESDHDAELIAEATYQFYKKYDLDFIKMMNNGMFSVVDYGATIDPSEVKKGGVTKVVETPINQYEDWANLKDISIEEGALKRELIHLEKLLKKVDGEAPVTITVFSPLTTADKLTKGRAPEFIKQDKDGLFKQALEKIAKVTGEFAEKAIEMGADGIFFATQLSSYDRLTEEEYKEYGVPYDLPVLEKAKNGWFNTIHVHGNNIMFDIVKDYPVDVFNWHAWETLPELKEGIDFVGKSVLGGIARPDITKDQRNQLRHQIYRSITESQGKHLILSPGCTVNHPFSDETIHFIKKVKKEAEALL